MATNHTTNYQLNQWEATDQVLRTEFNADNAKLDAALKANADAIAAEAAAREAGDEMITAGNCWVRVLDTTLETETQKWNIDMSGIDLSLYHRLVIYPCLTGDTDQSPYLHINGDEESLTQLPLINAPSQSNFGMTELSILVGLPYIFLTEQGNSMANSGATPYFLGVATIDLGSGVNHIDTMGFWFEITSAKFSPGARVQIYGLKR